MKIVLVNFMRLNSTRLPRKLLAEVGGRSLARIALQLLKDYQEFDTDVDICATISPVDEPLMEIADSLGVRVVERSLASRNGCTYDTIYEGWGEADLDWLIVVNPCFPFLTVRTVCRASSRIRAGASLMFATAHSQRGFVWDGTGKILVKQNIISSYQHSPVFYTTCAAIHAYPKHVLGGDKMLSEEMELLPVDMSSEFIDVDTQGDLDLARAYSQVASGGLYERD